jgi:hypothetical protein
MTENETILLRDLLDKLSEEKCEVGKGISDTCSVDCEFYINGSYGGECAIERVQDGI